MASIWIDVDNAPHVPFFAPLIRNFFQGGHEVIVTAREYGYTTDLMAQHALHYHLVGRHPGRNPFLKVVGLAARTTALVDWARRRKIDVGVSHGSRAMVVACFLLGIPCITMYDYEFVSTGVFNRLSDRILLPDILPEDLLVSLNLSPGRVARYPGLKEEVYLGDFTPDSSFLADLDIDGSQIIVALRPPATGAHYHNPESERIFEAVLDRISAQDDTIGIVLPRTADQGVEIGKFLQNSLKFRILTRSINGLNLLWHSDVVVGGGGTMNREAALLGVPVYSLFMGKMGTIDRMLADQDRLTWVRSVEEVTLIKFKKREKTDISDQLAKWRARSSDLSRLICEEVLRTGRQVP
jgi:predicted glycosyltransferase